ncbi:MAG: chloride channel protein [Thermoplasmatota archaeon]
MSLGAVVAGIVGGLAAVAFRGMVNVATNLFFFHKLALSFRSPSENTLGVAVVLVPLVGGVFVTVLARVLPGGDEGASTTEVVEAASPRGKAIQTKPSLSRILIAVITLGAGGSAGREGHIVLAGAMGGTWTSSWRSFGPRERRVLIAAGAAAALGATFNAPLTGLLFTLEVILLEFRTLSFVPLVISSVIGTTVGRAFLGDNPTFQFPHNLFTFSSAWELGLYALLGVLAGGVGLVLLWLYQAAERFPLPAKWPAFATPIVGGVLLGAVGLVEPRMFGVGYETVNAIFNNQFGGIEAALLLLGAILLLKPLAVVITLRSGGAGGVFSPTLFEGSVVGALFGYGVAYAFPSLHANPAAFALVGMVAVFAAVTRATLTSIVLAMEMTHSFGVVVPAMLACVIADLLAWAKHPGSLYTAKLQAKGRPVALDLEPNALDLMLVGEVMDRDPAPVTSTETVKDLVAKSMETGRDAFPIVDEAGRLVGVVTRGDLRNRTRAGESLDRPVAQIMTSELLVTYPDETVHVAISKMLAKKVRHLPVVTRAPESRLVGWITPNEALQVHSP